MASPLNLRGELGGAFGGAIGDEDGRGAVGDEVAGGELAHLTRADQEDGAYP